jgi:2-polyprenyl-3-methyl-5-hydroxy-6-metoxy-1,4-benzoquinol methylase
MQQPLISEISRKRKLKLLLKNLRPGASILEVGAGLGWFAQRLKESGYDVTTLDIVNPEADIIGDINQWQQLGIRRNSFDAVVALEVIEHIDCLSALCSICKIGGLIMLSSPHPNWDWVMKILENFKLTQRRTSKHINLTDFGKIQLSVVIRKRPLFIHQVAIFKNKKLLTNPATCHLTFGSATLQNARELSR